METMDTQTSISFGLTVLLIAFVLCAGQPALAQSVGTQTSATPASKPEDTEVWKPEPKVITPGAECNAPPSDAIILFDGKNLDQWVSAKDKSPAKWSVSEGAVTVNKPS